jgi:probable rRNA maturation factor
MLLIRNLTKKKIDEKFLRSAEEKTLSSLNRKNSIEISLVVCGEKMIKDLNRVWRGENRPTDVLSFGGKEAKKDFKPAPDGIVHFGEIFICYPVAEKQSRKYGYSIKEEMARLLVHGILHLAGYDHEKNKAEEKKMLTLQEKIVEKTLNK